MTDNDSLTVTYRKRTFIITKCHHEAGAFTDGCFGCAPNWGYACLEKIPPGKIKNLGFLAHYAKPSLVTNRAVMALPEVLAFVNFGQKDQK